LHILLKAIAQDLGDPTGWCAPVEFRGSLALCALNSADSLRATSISVKRVIARYRAVRPTADTDSGPDLISVLDDAGGPRDFARDILRNDSKLPGTSRPRTEGIYEGLTRFAALDVPPSVFLQDEKRSLRRFRVPQGVSRLGSHQTSRKPVPYWIAPLSPAASLL